MRRHVYTWTIVIVLGLISATMLHSQTRGPSPILPTLTTAENGIRTRIMADRPAFSIGWNWGPPPTQCGVDMKTNFWHASNQFAWGNNWSGGNFEHLIWLAPNATRHVMSMLWFIPKDLVPGSSPPKFVYPQRYKWYQAQVDEDEPRRLGEERLMVLHGAPNSLFEGIGIRYQPELDLDTTNFTPISGDQQGAVFGFLNRDLTKGTVSGQRLNLSKTGVSSWTSVLDNSWPKRKFGSWPARPFHCQSLPFNGYKMYLSINLRRTDAADVAMDDDQILRLKIYTKSNGSAPVNINFDSLPDPDDPGVDVTAANYQLPNTLSGASRGMAHPLDARTGTSAVTEIIITRRMLPPGNASTDNRDVTVMAHFNLFKDLNHAPVWPQDENNFLRDRWFLNSAMVSHEITRGDIEEMWVKVEYIGNSDVAIDWVQIGTEAMTWATQGYSDDDARIAHNDILAKLEAHNIGARGGAESPDRLRLWKWYNRDEGYEANWETMRHYHQLMDNNTTTELNANHNMDRYHHLTGIQEIWQGTTPLITRQAAPPYYKVGTHGLAPLNSDVFFKRLGIPWAVNENVPAPFPHKVDYDTYYQPSSAPGNLPAPLGSWSISQEYPNGPLYKGLQQCYESQQYLIAEKTDYLFKDEAWLSNIWLSPSWGVFENASGAKALNWHYHTARFLTGEEVRLVTWGQVILGSKGLVYYWGAASDSATQVQHFVNTGVGYDYGFAYGTVRARYETFAPDGNGGWTMNFNQRTDAPARNGFLQGLNYDDVRLGPDYLDANNSSGLFQALDDSPYSVSDITTALGVPTSKFFLGWHSQRLAVQEVNTVLSRAADTLGRLRLLAWYNHGFRKWTKHRSTNSAEQLSQFLDVSRLATRHPHRDGRFPDTVAQAINWENKDSSFVELTLLRDGATSLQSAFVVGVLNRRCNPFDYWASTKTDYSTFRTMREKWIRDSISIAMNGYPKLRYGQNGARQIRIPFNFQPLNGKYRLLRVRSMGEVTDPTVGSRKIDTVIGMDKDLVIDFLPGEGKMLYVEVIAADALDLVDRGFLDHNGQRKLVAFPEMDRSVIATADGNKPVDTERLWTWTQYIPGARMRYHSVYYRLVGDDLRVFYRRSEPMSFEASNQAGQPNSVRVTGPISWEQEIEISQVVRGRNEEVRPIKGCAYPSIVVRPQTDGGAEPRVTWTSGQANATNNHNMVYITFACKECINDNWKTDIVYLTFRADVARADQVMDIGESPGHVIDEFDIPADKIDSALHRWGTPVINASARGNYVAWSTIHSGIRTLFLFPQEKFQVNGRVPYEVPKHNQPHKATHPSLNSYSRLNLGEQDAALVWQEGLDSEMGLGIFYTRLLADQAGVVTHFIARNIANRVTVDQWGDLVGGNLVLCVGGPGQDPPLAFGIYPTEMRTVRYPAIFRNLSDYTILPSNSRYISGLESSKAERIVWETKVPVGFLGGDPLPGRWEIARRAIDVDDHGFHDPALPPRIWGRGPYLLWSPTRDLSAPTIAQGEQTSENVGVPSPVDGLWYEDSVNVLNFHDGSDIWHLTFGWWWYGQMVNHQVDNGVFPAEALNPGRYPQLAARFSMAHHPGWQRNRRLFEAFEPRIGVPTYTQAPLVKTGAEGFYKTDAGTPYKFVEFVGFRDQIGRTWSVGGVSLDDDETNVKFDLVDKNGEGRSRAGTKPVRVYQPTVLQVLSRIDPDFPAGVLTIRRNTDGDTLTVPLEADTNGSYTVNRWLVVNGTGEEYTFQITSEHESLGSVFDVAILPNDQGLSRSVPVLHRGSIDLATMRVVKPTRPAVNVHPIPARDHVSLEILGFEPSVNSADCMIYDLSGALVLSTKVNPHDQCKVDTSKLPSGAYTLRVLGDGLAVSTTFIIL